METSTGQSIQFPCGINSTKDGWMEKWMGGRKGQTRQGIKEEGMKERRKRKEEIYRLK